MAGGIGGLLQGIIPAITNIVPIAGLLTGDGESGGVEGGGLASLFGGGGNPLNLVGSFIDLLGLGDIVSGFSDGGVMADALGAAGGYGGGVGGLMNGLMGGMGALGGLGGALGGGGNMSSILNNTPDAALGQMNADYAADTLPAAAAAGAGAVTEPRGAAPGRTTGTGTGPGNGNTGEVPKPAPVAGPPIPTPPGAPLGTPGRTGDSMDALFPSPVPQAPRNFPTNPSDPSLLRPTDLSGLLGG